MRYSIGSAILLALCASCTQLAPRPVSHLTVWDHGSSPATQPGSASFFWYQTAGRYVLKLANLKPATVAALQDAQPTGPDWQRVLAVHAVTPDNESEPNLPPMAGEYKFENDWVEFHPRFALSPGVTYRAAFRDPAAGNAREYPSMILKMALPARTARSTTEVRAVYPSTDLVPENLLKFYVHFSAPMRGGNIYSHIRVATEEGQTVELPFLEIDEELWDPAMTRLTLFIDPGRIKRGVLPLEEIGPALEEGKSYRLVINRAWPDANGAPLRSNFTKRFRVGPPDRDPPDPARWKIQIPKPMSREALVIDFPEPMDHALARRMIRVADASGLLLPGDAALVRQERRWTFKPTAPWRAGEYKIVIQTTIEDLAGNNIGKPFEVDLVEPVQKRITSETVSLPFWVKP